MAKKRKSNNTTTWLLIIGGVLVVGYIWLRQQLDLIQIGSVSIPFQKLEGTSVRLGIRLPITNASALAAKVTGFTGFILTPTGSVLSTVFLDKPAVVNRFAQAELEFTSMLRATDVALELFNILQSGQMPDWKGYRIKGQLRVYGFPLPIESSIV